MKYDYAIYSRLAEYKDRDRVRLHMPGHKNLGAFRSLFPVAPIDVTELSYSDDLGCPTGVIRTAENDLAQILGARRAFLTTDGSSSGVMALVYAASKRGRKLIIMRNSHKSVYNACRLFGVEPVVIRGEEREGVLLPPSAETVAGLCASDAEIAGLLVTSPDYYGNVAPMKEYAAALNGRLLLADGAHGAHLALDGKGEDHAGRFADGWVDGAHKTLPTLTQGAVVCVNRGDILSAVEEGLSMFRTTSPSYPVMASVEYGVKYYVNNRAEYERAKAACLRLKEQLSSLAFYPSRDWTKLALDCKPLGISPALAEEILQKRGIYSEMNDGRYLLFYLSPSVGSAQLKKLRSALLSLAGEKSIQHTYREKPALPPAERSVGYLYALGAESERIPLRQAAGRVCAENAGITPPCIPVAVAGEILSPAAVAALAEAERTFGLDQGKIKVVKTHVG